MSKRKAGPVYTQGKQRNFDRCLPPSRVVAKSHVPSFWTVEWVFITIPPREEGVLKVEKQTTTKLQNRAQNKMSRPMPERKSSSKRFFSNYSHRWLPGEIETDLTTGINNNTTQPIGGPVDNAGSNHLDLLGRRRTWRRRLFLLITEPHTSTGSLIFYLVLIVVILSSNVFEIMQTVESWQYIPTDCVSCGGYVPFESIHCWEILWCLF